MDDAGRTRNAPPRRGIPDAVLAAAWRLVGHNPLTEPFVALATELAAQFDPAS